MNGTRHLLTNMSFRVRQALGTHPGLFLPLASLRYGRDYAGSLIAVGPGTEIVIEGFPRSANTFAVRAFRLAQGRPVNVAHHLHVPAQVFAGLRRRIPMVVLIREPDEAVASFLVREPHVDAWNAASAYVRFYESVLPFRSGFVLATFQDVTQDFGKIIRRVNSRFGTAFREFDHTPENVRRCFEEIEARNRLRFGGGRIIEQAVARPSPTRDLLKPAVLGRLDRGRIVGELQRARQVYALITTQADP